MPRSTTSEEELILAEAEYDLACGEVLPLPRRPTDAQREQFIDAMKRLRVLRDRCVAIIKGR